MRTLETLIRQYPDLTGKEILAIQEQDKLKDKKAFDKSNNAKLNFIKDINTNGGYFRGKFGLDQHFFYNVKNVRLEGTEIYGDVEKLVLFINLDGHTHTVTNPGDINLEKRTKTFQSLENYGLDAYDRITEKEWNDVNDYINNIVKFW